MNCILDENFVHDHVLVFLSTYCKQVLQQKHGVVNGVLTDWRYSWAHEQPTSHRFFCCLDESDPFIDH
jgi:hypothetical protein